MCRGDGMTMRIANTNRDESYKELMYQPYRFRIERPVVHTMDKELDTMSAVLSNLEVLDHDQRISYDMAVRLKMICERAA